MADALASVDDLIEDILGDGEADGPPVGTWIFLRRLDDGDGAGDEGVTCA